MKRPYFLHSAMVVFLALPLLSASAGCSTMALSPSSLFGGKRPAEEAPPSQGMAVVELRTKKGKPAKIVQMPLQGTLHVQDAVSQSRALKKFRRINVEILRPVGDGNRQRMACQYDIKTKKVKPEYDYALMAGDYIVITEDTTTIVDDMLRDFAGPITHMTR